jgi:catechol 2,3-dioxygenase-like lactoylglutathione lyase family enzyme
MDTPYSTQDSDTMLTPFHIAFPVDDIAAARRFYGTILGCAEGRSTDSWIDFDLFGHQIVAHYKPRGPQPPRRAGSAFWGGSDHGEMGGVGGPTARGKHSVHH